MRNKKLIILFSVLFAITLLIVLSSVIFSVQNVYAYCYNSDGSKTNQMVLDKSKIKKNSNIFMLNEAEIIKNVNSNVPNVRVINIEKKFPNKIYINYIELKEYVKIFCNGKTFFCSNDGKILRKVDGEDKQSDAIELVIKGELLSTNVGDDFKSDNLNDLILLTTVLNSLSQLGYSETVVDLINKIDISSNVNIILTTKTGMLWKVIGADYMLEKLQLALSTYTVIADKEKTGVLIITGNPPQCQHQKEGKL